MAGSLSDYGENLHLDAVLGSGTPATVYIGLWTAALDDTSTGATAGEVAAGDYARLAVTNNSTNWPAASGGAKANGTAFTFAEALASWGTITHIAILDSATEGAGNIIGWADLDVAKAIALGDTFEIAVGDLDITLA